ncbi:MAG: hypothetical protein ACK526_21385 [Planctomyces sp.]
MRLPFVCPVFVRPVMMVMAPMSVVGFPGSSRLGAAVIVDHGVQPRGPRGEYQLQHDHQSNQVVKAMQGHASWAT